jgi:hypothetical protein
MCGIAGYSCYGEYDRRLDVAITTLGLFMQDRGRQAWGWTDGKQLVKATGSIRDGWNGSFLGRFTQAALHTRQPTHGSVVKENSHPFEIGKIIGIHNGIVHNHDDLNKKYNRTFAVDSMHIFAHLDQGLPLDELRAYGAVVFWKDGKLHLGRFNNGDLNLARTETAWVFASTKTALSDALRLSGLNKNVFYYKLKEERCYVIDGEDLRVSEDIALNFGSYSKSYGTWDDYPQEGDKKYGVRTDLKEEDGWVREHNQWGGNVWRYDPSKDQRGKGKKKDKEKKSTPPTQQPLLPVGNMSTEEKIAEMVKSFAEADLKKKEPEKQRKEEPDWKCGFCDAVLRDGEKFYFTQTSELSCEDCALRFTDEMAGGPLYELPIEICKVESLMTDEDKKSGGGFNCDICDEPLEVSDEFVNTRDGQFLCLQCFAEGSGEADNREEQTDIAAAEDAYLTQQFEEAMAEAESFRKTLEAEPSNEAENLKNHGAAIPEATAVKEGQVVTSCDDDYGYMCGEFPFGNRFLN